MSENGYEDEVWVPVNPGDLLTADAWNEMQKLAKAEIQETGTALEEKIEEVEGKLDEVDAAKFGGKSPDEWSEQFAPKVHDHEGQAVYRRYIKQFTTELNKVFLEHKLGRFPLVDVYELLPLTSKVGFADCKLLFYYGKEDADDFDLWIRV